MFGKKFSSNIRRKKHMTISIIITLFLILSIGYSAISTDLGISGELGVSKYNPDVVQIEFIETSTPESPDGYNLSEDYEFDIKVKNLTNTELTNVVLTIEKTGDEYEIGNLASLDESTLQTAFTITDYDPDFNVITAVVTGLINDQEFTVVKKINVPVIDVNDDLTIEVVADPPTSGGDSYSLGDRVNLTITVTNTGTTTLEVVTQTPDDSNTVYLKSGEKYVFYYGAYINETDVANGKASYTFGATGKRSGEVVVERNKTIELNVNS